MKFRVPFFASAGLAVAVALLYGGFLRSPIVFDDIYFFIDDTLLRYGHGDFSFRPRWLPYFTLGLSRRLFDLEIVAYRLPSLLLHASVTIALYLFLRRLWAGLLPEQGQEVLSYRWMAFFAALIFALHPVAVYGAGYLVERTIVMATLFALLMWWAWLRGLEEQRMGWFWLSVLFYALALSSKEHVIMAPAVSLALLLIWWRTHWKNQGDVVRRWTLRLGPVFLAYALMALYVFLAMKGLLGKTYEPLGPDSASQVAGLQAGGLAYPLSVFNQGALFFKYLGLWFMPSPAWLSVDMREPFVTSFWAWPYVLGFAGFVVYPVAALMAMWRGGRTAVLGLAMVSPWLLFATEISTVRIQEPFVLYRSYLWMAPAFAGLVLLFGQMERRRSALALGLVALVMYPLAYQRLQTFSHPYLLWDDAARLVEGRDNLTGLARIYLNRGHELEKLGHSEEAIADYTRALQENSAYYRPFLLSDRGASYMSLKQYALALRDFDAAIQIKNDNALSFMGRGLALVALNRKEASIPDFVRACQLGLADACKKTIQPVVGK